ncbi:hypothetical protein D8S78_04075 [Natrialba swarupiae]|nr:hypothetical protein [Natrialba swarupiae]
MVPCSDAPNCDDHPYQLELTLPRLGSVPSGFHPTEPFRSPVVSRSAGDDSSRSVRTDRRRLSGSRTRHDGQPSPTGTAPRTEPIHGLLRLQRGDRVRKPLEIA